VGPGRGGPFLRGGGQRSAAWQRIGRRFHNGHHESWWVAELAFLHFGPRKAVRALCVTTDRRRLPSQTTWYLSSNLKGSSLEEIIQLYAWRNWTEQGYKQVKGELGWADFQVRGDTAIRRHWALVCAAFGFCWWQAAREGRLAAPAAPRPACTKSKPARAGRAGVGKISAPNNLSPGRRRCARCEPGWLPSAGSRAAGMPGRRRRHRRRSQRCLRPSDQGRQLTSISRNNKLPLRRRVPLRPNCPFAAVPALAHVDRAESKPLVSCPRRAGT
jgi:hypothetical protein